jgi:hypothetical protein
MRSLLVTCFFAILLFSTLPVFYILNTASAQESMTLQNQKVVYDMPYPGLLPDSPLYFIKIVRDRATEFFTRDNIKKANLYLNYSDKRAVMSLKLAEKGKKSACFNNAF